MVHAIARRDFLAEVERRGKSVERHDALRPVHGGRQREPDARNDAVRAPGVENFVDGFAFVQDHARLRLHRDHFDGAHRLKIAQPAVRHRADASRATAEKSAERRLNDRRGIAAQFPSHLARFILEIPQAHSGLANGHAVRLDFLDAVHRG